MTLPPNGPPAAVHELLRPSLAREDDGERRSPFSVQALILTAFIGGPLALAGLLGVSAKRTGRLARDLPYLLLLCAIWLGTLGALVVELKNPPGPLASLNLARTDLTFLLRHGGRALAFAAVGLFYLRHRRLYRALASLGRRPPPATAPAIVCVVLAQGVASLAGYLALRSGMP